MSRRIGIREVANKAGVAVSSVSRVISDHPDVSPEMRKRVFAAVQALGYEPDILAQSLRRGSTRTIGLLVSDISNPLFSEIALGAESALNEAGYALLIANSRGISENDGTHLKLLRQRRVDGFLLSLSNESDKGTISLLRSLDRPFVLLDRDIPRLQCSSVLSDHSSGIRAAAAHLLNLGHKRIAMMGGNPHVRPTRARSEALVSACKDLREVHVEIHEGSFSPEHGEHTTDNLLGGKNPPTAIIAGSNQILIGVLRSLRRHKMRIPEDISLVTVDRVPMLEFTDPPITTIERDCRHIGSVAAQILLDLLEGKPHHETLLPVKFDPNASCAPPADKRKRR